MDFYRILKLYEYWRHDPPVHWMIRAYLRPESKPAEPTREEMERESAFNAEILKGMSHKIPRHFATSSSGSIPPEVQTYFERLNKNK